MLFAVPTLALVAACGGGDGGGSAEDKAAVEQTIREVASYGGEDVDAFLERVTDNFLLIFNGFTRDECRDNADECVGEPAESVTLSNTSVDGDEATTDAAFGGQPGFHLYLVREDGVWKVDDISDITKEIPDGVTKVDLELNEFAFGFNRADVKDGDFAFAVKNVGNQHHVVAVSRIPEDLDLEEAIASGEEPEGAEDIVDKGPFRPGDEGSVVFDEPLEPGRYVLLCFLPDTEDPDKTPHFQKGMYAEFTVEE
ncbi:MAG: hypothetical protein HYY03_04040 [Chloroflexi bacterium]|nr:hypothetical protein [Chloroflexota bacterium]